MRARIEKIKILHYDDGFLQMMKEQGLPHVQFDTLVKDMVKIIQSHQKERNDYLQSMRKNRSLPQPRGEGQRQKTKAQWPILLVMWCVVLFFILYFNFFMGVISSSEV